MTGLGLPEPLLSLLAMAVSPGPSRLDSRRRYLPSQEQLESITTLSGIPSAALCSFCDCPQCRRNFMTLPREVCWANGGILSHRIGARNSECWHCRQSIESSEHDADPFKGEVGKHTPQHCSGLSSVKAQATR
jgi:hypothetical protein